MSKYTLLLLFSLVVPVCYAETSKILLQTDGMIITEQVLMSEIEGLPEKQKGFLLSSPAKLNEYIDIYYREKLFEYLAIKQKLNETPKYRALLIATKRRLLTNLLIEDKKKKLVIPDLTKSANDYYSVNKPKFKISKQVEVRHILLKSKKDDKNKQEIRQRLVDILERIKQDPKQFEALAKEYSEDLGSAKKGGRLGRFSKNHMVAEFEQEAFNLTEPGQLTEVFSTKFGFHIIQLIKVYPATTASFKQVKPQILANLRNKYIEEEYTRWRNDIVDPDKATINQEKLQEFVQKLLKNKKP